MTPQQLNAAAKRRTDDLYRGFGEDVRRLRADAGVSQRALARFAGVDQSQVARIEAGRARPSLATCQRLSLGLGSDLSVRLFPNTGPPIRDRHQARIVEALTTDLSRRWRTWPEVGVRQPVRGWIDAVLADLAAGDVIATEIVSAIGRFEQLLRWSSAKSEALPSALAWPFGIEEPRLSRLLIVRSTAANRAILDGLRASCEAAFPADPWQAHAALFAEASWPGAALLWAREHEGRFRIAATPRA